MILGIPGDRHFEAYFLSNSSWRWKPRVTSDGHFTWLYWGRFALGVTRRIARRRVRSSGFQRRGPQHAPGQG